MPAHQTTDKIDRRITRTRRLLSNAFMELISTKSYKDITITDITELADVAYVTFFRHYTDKDDFFAKVVADDISQLMQQVEAIPQESSPSFEQCTIMFQHIQSNDLLYRTMLSDPATCNVREQIKDWHVDMILKKFINQYTDGSLIPLEIAANHMAASELELIDWWLQNDMPYPPERMGQIFRELIINGTWQLVSENCEPPY